MDGSNLDGPPMCYAILMDAKPRAFTYKSHGPRMEDRASSLAGKVAANAVFSGGRSQKVVFRGSFNEYLAFCDV